jgi:hypothetical protein
VDAHEQGQLLPNRLLTQAEPLRPLRFYRPPRPGIAKYEKEHETCVRNDRGDLNLKRVVSEDNKNEHCRQKQNGDNNEHSPFFEKYNAGDSRTLGIIVPDRKTFDEGHIAIGAAVNVGRILGLALGAEHGKPRL